MAIVTTDDRHYTEIAAAIREATGTETAYKPSEMPAGVSEVYEAGKKDGQEESSKLARSIIDRSITEIADADVTEIGEYAFSGCTSLTKATFPNVTKLGSFAFSGCSAFTVLDICSYPFDCTIVGDINSSPQLSVIMRNPNVCSVDEFTNWLGETTPQFLAPLGGDGYFYIPASMWDAYVEAWGGNQNLLSQVFRKIEDYPEICGTT